MADYPDFEKIIYRKPELSSIAGKKWTWFVDIPIAGGAHGTVSVHSVPTGYRAILTDIGFSAEFKGECKVYIPDGDKICWVHFEPYRPFSHSLTTPSVLKVGETLDFEIWNRDTELGDIKAWIIEWRTPGSEPEKPKTDDPAERFRVGDFNTATHLVLPNGESLFFFHKWGEKKENYLRIKDFGTPKQKKLASLHLKPEEAQEIMSTLHDRPEKAQEVLRRIENKKSWPRRL